MDLVCDLATDPIELGRATDIVFVCVSDTPTLEEVVFGESGVINGLARGGGPRGPLDDLARCHSRIRRRA